MLLAILNLRRSWLAAAALSCLVLGGCASRTSPSAERTLVGSRPAPIAEEDWPRRAQSVFPLTAPTTGRTESALIDRAVTFFIPQDDWRAWQRSMEAGAAMRRVGMIGRGHLSEVVTPHATEGEHAGRPVGTEWTSLLLFFTSSEDDDLPYTPVRKGAILSGGPALESSLTTMRYFQARKAPVRGLVVHLTGIRGCESETYIAREFTSRGWAVLSIPPPSKAVEHESLGHWTERPIDREEGIDAAARRMARLTDWGMAEWAYAAEAGVKHLQATHEELRGAPVVGVGCSIGALALPATAARLGDLSAAVLVAGGGPVLRILHESDATAVEAKVRWTDRALREDEWTRLIEVTREESRLDPTKAAEFLRVMPVLQVHAAMDGIVPADTGDELYEALGRPERWSFPVGHVGMFVVLPFLIGEVADWIEAHVPARETNEGFTTETQRHREERAGARDGGEGAL